MKNNRKWVIGLVLFFSAVAFVPAMAFPWQEKIHWQNYALVYQRPLTFDVDSTLDDFDAHPGDGICATPAGLCTLRAAIQEAQSIEEIDKDVTVEVPAGVFTLTQHTYPSSPFHIVIARYNAYHVILHGQGPEKTIIQGDGTLGIFKVYYSAVFSGLTIQNGHSSAVVSTGGISVEGASEAIIVNCILRNNHGVEGGAVKASYQSYLTIIDSTLTGNTAAEGGGIFSYYPATLIVQDSTISSNSAGWGAGIYNRSTLSLENSTISGNSAQSGGGIYNWTEGHISIYSSTITENTAGKSGGGIEVNGTPSSEGQVRLYNSILAGNHQANTPDCYVAVGHIFSYDYNLIGNTAGCVYTAGIGDKINVNAGLAPLGSNGGPTQTHALLANSPAIDGGNPDGCVGADYQVLLLDQRGSPRPQDGDRDGAAVCDIGAFETAPLYGMYLPVVSR